MLFWIRDRVRDVLQFAVTVLKEDSASARRQLSGLDWEAFKQLMLRHRIGPAVSRNLRQLEIPVPEDVTAFLTKLYKKNVALMFVHVGVVHRILRLFQDNHIEFMVLKGLSIRNGYPQLFDRHVNDLDILIREETDIWRAVSLLKTIGMTVDERDPENWNVPQKNEFLRKKRHIEVKSRDHLLLVDVHFRLFAFLGNWKLDTETLWANRSEADIYGRNIIVLNAEKQLEYLVLHGSACGWFRLKWLIDVYYILRFKTEEELTEIQIRACADGWCRPLLLTLSVLRVLFGIHLPCDIRRLIETDSTVLSLTQEVLCRLESITAEERYKQSPWVRGMFVFRRGLYLVKLQPGLKSTWWILSGIGFSPENWETVRLPARLHFIYVFFHPFIHLYRVLRGR